MTSHGESRQEDVTLPKEQMSQASDIDIRVPFIGRGAYFAIITDALSRNRLVTLCGSGGIGKSRLAYEFASRNFPPSEILWCSLGSVHDGGVLASMAHALAIDAIDGDLSKIVERLKSTRSLVIFDNCEHLRAEVAATVKELLAMTSLQILATSRARLRLASEDVIEVRPFEHDEALQFLVERARLSVPNFSIASHEKATATNIVTRLDHLALAIDLAAARLGDISLNELDASLDRLVPRNFRDNTTTEQRHRSLRSVVEWSGKLISDDARFLLACVSMLSSAFTSGDAALLTGFSDDSGRIEQAIQQLHEQSLIGTRKDGKFLVLVPVRTIAVTWISEINDRMVLRERLCKRMAEIAQGVLDRIENGDAVAAIATVNECHGDFINALNWMLDHPAFLRRYSAIIFALTAVSADGGTVRIGNDSLDKAIALQVDDRDLRARLMYERARTALVACDYSLVCQLANQTVAMFNQLGNRLYLAKSHNALCVALPYCNDAPGAYTHGLIALQLFEHIGDGRGIAVTHINLGVIAMDSRNDFAEAEQHFTNALLTSRAAKLSAQEMFAVLNLAALAILKEDRLQSTHFAEKTRELAVQHGSLPIQARAEQYLAYIAMMGKNTVLAASHLDASLMLLDRENNPRCLADAADGATELAFLCTRDSDCVALNRIGSAYRDSYAPSHPGALTRRASSIARQALSRTSQPPESPLIESDKSVLTRAIRTFVADIAGRQALQ